MINLKLSKRLAAIASYIEKGASVADIGTDHGYLPVYLAKNGLASRIIASDKSEGSLNAARRSASKHGVTDKITFIAAPGLTGISETEIDTVVIAGMGGETIIGILSEAPQIKREGIRLILQPQTKTYELSRWLTENGYEIKQANLIQERSKYYTVILAVYDSGIRDQGSVLVF